MGQLRILLKPDFIWSRPCEWSFERTSWRRTARLFMGAIGISSRQVEMTIPVGEKQVRLQGKRTQLLPPSKACPCTLYDRNTVFVQIILLQFHDGTNLVPHTKQPAHRGITQNTSLFLVQNKRNFAIFFPHVSRYV